MKAKVASGITIASVILVAVVVSLIIVFSGMKNGGYNYVKLELNPQIEFVTDTKDKVISYNAQNEEARILTSNLNLIGLDIEQAVNTVLQESLKVGYLTTESNKYNVIKLTVVPGLTQALEVHTYRAINKFLVKNEVMALIVENQNDMEYIKEAIKLNISANKLALINSIVNSSNGLTKEQLKNKMEDELIDIIKEMQSYNLKYNKPTELEINKKEELLLNNKSNYEEHIASINKKEAGKFVKELQDLSKTEQKKYELNYSKNIELNKQI